MVALFRKLIAHRNLLKNLILRDLKHRYVGSIGGFLWSVVHPIALLVSYTFVFSVIAPPQMGPEYGTNSFAIFVLSGLLPWMLFSDTVVRNCSVISDNAPLITKTVIPAEILPVSITLSNLIHHFIGLGLLLVVLVAFQGVHLSAVWIALYVVMLLLLAQGLGFMVAGLQVFLRDTMQGLQIVMLLWFFFTPILYTVDRVPQRFQAFFGLNPMALIVTGYRSAILHVTQPTAFQIACVFAASLAVFVIGGLLFRQAKPGFPDVL